MSNRKTVTEASACDCYQLYSVAQKLAHFCTP